MGQVTSELLGRVNDEHVGGVTSKHIDQITDEYNDRFTDDNMLIKAVVNINLWNNNEERLLYVTLVPIFQYPSLNVMYQYYIKKYCNFWKLNIISVGVMMSSVLCFCKKR